MRKLMKWVLFPALVAAGAALTVSTPAQAAPKTVRVAYMGPGQLSSLCAEIGGSFDDLGFGDSMCVLPDGRVMVCYASVAVCTWHYATAAKPDWRDSAVLGNVVLQNPVSPQPAVTSPAARIKTVLSR